jgi:hypothetical protein
LKIGVGTNSASNRLKSATGNLGFTSYNSTASAASALRKKE